jgi:protein phosphatase 1G
MGAALTYLKKPQTTPHIEHVSIPNLADVAVGGVQGWRRSMEDAHLVTYDKEHDILMVGVFDGHGGKGVANYVSRRLPELVQSSTAYKARDFGLALHEGFLAMDAEMISSQEAKDTIKQLDVQQTHEETDSVRVDLAMLLEICTQNPDGVLRLRPGIHNIKKVIETALAKGENPLPKIFEGPALSKFRPAENSLVHYDLAVSEIFDALIGHDGDPAMQGCTATVAIIDFAASEIICANAGDSRTMVARDGHPALLSVDHKPADPVEKLRIHGAGGRVIGRGDAARVEGDLNLSRALGDFRFKQNTDLPPELQMISARPDIRKRKLCGKDTFVVLGCDGIWEKLPTDTAIEFLYELVTDVEDQDVQKNLDAAIRDALTAAMCQNLDMDSEQCDFTGCDNMTLMLVRLSDAFRAKLPESVDESLAAAAPTVYGHITAPSRKRKLKTDGFSRVKKRRPSESSSVSK